MKKRILTAGTLAIIACAITAYCWAAGQENNSKVATKGTVLEQQPESDAIKSIRELEPKATVLDGYAIARSQVSESKERVLEWLKKIGF